jgi:hypothetical protein
MWIKRNNINNKKNLTYDGVLALDVERGGEGGEHPTLLQHVPPCLSLFFYISVFFNLRHHLFFSFRGLCIFFYSVFCYRVKNNCSSEVF